MRRLLLLGLLGLVLAAPADALAARWAIGVQPGDFDRVAAELPGARTLVPDRALVVSGPRPQVSGVRYITRIDAKRTLSFPNTEPLAQHQWYLTQNRAWDYWLQPPRLRTVKVAVIDSGIDIGHPEFAGRVIGGRSFVEGSWQQDSIGHGTFVAGIISANPANNVGIAGMGINTQLLIGKVVAPSGVTLESEVRAIRWAVDSGAQVINLSLGGLRNPRDRRLDTFSPPENDAVLYARRKGVVVVAAVGNGPDAPFMPWPYANYPAALPHVIGVGALRKDGVIPSFSNRDDVYLDLVAPGQGVFSTIPRNLVELEVKNCNGEPYSDCGSLELRRAFGTSFAAPQVTAAAALLLGQSPKLTPDQVAWLLTRSATDVTGGTGCDRCIVGRDSVSGWGRLNVKAAFNLLRKRSLLPPADRYEPNDDARSFAKTLNRLPRVLNGTLDSWEDPNDVFAFKVPKGSRVVVNVTSPGATVETVLWKPKTPSIFTTRAKRHRAAQSTKANARTRRLVYESSTRGVHYLQMKLLRGIRGDTSYRVSIVVVRPAR